MTSPHVSWLPGQTIKLKGMTVQLSRPRLVARSRDYLWFPSLARRGDGAIVALASEYPDVTAWPSPQWIYFSYDEGLTWPDKVRVPAVAGVVVNLPNGDLVLLPCYLMKEAKAHASEGYLLRKGSTQLEPHVQTVRVDDAPVEFLCTPRPATASPEEHRIVSGFTGQAVRSNDGQYLAGIYGAVSVKPNPRRYGVALAESDDAVNWRIRSAVALPGEGIYTGNEGANEATLGRVADGRLLCVYRAGGWHPYQAFGHAWSSDEGRTWTPGTPMPAGDSFIPPMAVQPSLVTMPDGTLLLSGGRPGLRFWVDPTGTAEQWQHIDLQLHHTWCCPQEPILGTDHYSRKQSTSYTELLPLDDRNLLLIYDRTPNGWDRIPDDMNDTNSLWLVRVTLERTA